MARITNEVLLERLNVEEALEAAYVKGWQAAYQRQAECDARAVPKPADLSQESYLKLTNSMGQCLQSMAGGLEAVAHALDNFRSKV